MKCDFCEQRMPIYDEYGRYELQCVKLIPLPAINLTTGEKEETPGKPFYSLFLYEDGEPGEQGSFLIKYCPWCGRKLEGGGDE